MEGHGLPGRDLPRNVKLKRSVHLRPSRRVRVPDHQDLAAETAGRERGSSDTRRELARNGLELRRRNFLHPLKARLHLRMHPVDGAAADRIVRVILEGNPPCEVEESAVNFAAEGGEPGGQGLEIARQEPVVAEVSLLLRRTGGGTAGKQWRTQAGAELTPVHGEVS